MFKNIRILVLALLMFATTVFAQTSQNNEGYLVDQNSNIVRSGTGLCWHTGYWTPAMAVEGCDPVGRSVPSASKVTLNADMLFAFNKYNLTDYGKKVLDGIVVDLGNFKTVEIVAIIGYTDRIGPDSYNLKLSERRAKTVQDYLISKNVPKDSIFTVGRGKENPVTGDSCKGAVTNKLIACLQPDRRAVIEIIGTK